MRKQQQASIMSAACRSLRTKWEGHEESVRQAEAVTKTTQEEQTMRKTQSCVPACSTKRLSPLWLRCTSQGPRLSRTLDCRDAFECGSVRKGAAFVAMVPGKLLQCEHLCCTCVPEFPVLLPDQPFQDCMEARLRALNEGAGTHFKCSLNQYDQKKQEFSLSKLAKVYQNYWKDNENRVHQEAGSLKLEL